MTSNFSRTISIKLQLTLWYSFSLTLLLVLFSSCLYFYFQHTLHQRLDQQIEEDFSLVVEMLTFNSNGEIIIQGERSYDDSLFRHEKRWLEVIDAKTGERLFPSKSPLGPFSHQCSREFHSYAKNAAYRIYCSRFSLGTKHLFIRVARLEEPIRYELSQLFAFFLLFIPIGVVASSLGGLFLANRALSPVDDIVELAQEISAHNLQRRIPVDGKGDEMDRLAQVLNHLLDRLEKSFESLKRFTSDASHELRTPVTSIHLMSEIALTKPLSPEEYHSVIDSIHEETISINRLIESLLMLSRMDGQQIQIEKKWVKIKEIVSDSLRPLNQAAKERAIQLHLDFERELDIFCDPSLLSLTLRNLVQNAIHYSASQSSITISARSNESVFEIAITDNGEGISKENITKIFQRFYRCEESRSRASGGNGLGLPLADWIVESHGGRIDVKSILGVGSTFKILIPNNKDMSL